MLILIRVANEQAAAAEKARQDELDRIAAQEAVELTKYHVIVGSFLTPAYADDWLGHIKDLGYDAKLVEMNGRKMASGLGKIIRQPAGGMECGGQASRRISTGRPGFIKKSKDYR